MKIQLFDLRFEGYRLQNKVAERILLASILEKGIREPLQGVDTEHARILLNGFKRYRCARRLGIDNTSLARLRGTGKNAVIVPEMVEFAKSYGFEFLCHEKGHANRKAGNERGFFTTETNFFPGREFQDLEDLNRQALEWATVRSAHRPVGKSRLIPAQAFEFEQSSFQSACQPQIVPRLSKLLQGQGPKEAGTNLQG